MTRSSRWFALTTLSVLLCGGGLRAAGAQDVHRVPGSWVDVSAGERVLANLASVAVRRIGDEEKAWIGYSFPLRDDVHVDCDDEHDGRRMTFGSRGVSIHIDTDEAPHGPCDDTVVLLIELERDGRTASRARMSTLRRAGEVVRAPVVWGGVFAARESIEYLRRAVLDAGDVAAPLATTSPRVRERLLGAIAIHDDPESAAIVAQALNSQYPSQLRESAVFWTAQLAGQDGARRLLALAREDADAEVRKQAIFWLGQLAGDAATRGLVELAENDPDVEIRKNAVFALSQSDDDEAIDALIAIVDEHGNAEVVRSALFWLGQSGDRRAIELFERLLFGGR